MRRAAAAVLIAALVAAPDAQGHGIAKWIGDSQIKNRAGDLCCGEKDCGVRIAGKIVAVAGGYRVDAVFRITTDSGEVIDEEVHELVPYGEAMPSPDGRFYRCRWAGERKCFFAPLPDS